MGKRGMHGHAIPFQARSFDKACEVWVFLPDVSNASILKRRNPHPDIWAMFIKRSDMS